MSIRTSFKHRLPYKLARKDTNSCFYRWLAQCESTAEVEISYPLDLSRYDQLCSTSQNSTYQTQLTITTGLLAPLNTLTHHKLDSTQPRPRYPTFRHAVTPKYDQIRPTISIVPPLGHDRARSARALFLRRSLSRHCHVANTINTHVHSPIANPPLDSPLLGYLPHLSTLLH